MIIPCSSASIVTNQPWNAQYIWDTILKGSSMRFVLNLGISVVTPSEANLYSTIQYVAGQVDMPMSITQGQYSWRILGRARLPGYTYSPNGVVYNFSIVSDWTPVISGSPVSVVLTAPILSEMYGSWPDMPVGDSIVLPSVLGYVEVIP